MNSRYFHNIIKARRRHNFIGSIDIVSGVIHEVGDIKEEVRRHFEDKFTEPDDESMFNTISDIGKFGLEEKFLEEEIRQAVWGCDGTKIPGPVEYNFFFIKKCWYFMKEYFFLVFQRFL